MTEVENLSNQQYQCLYLTNKLLVFEVYCSSLGFLADVGASHSTTLSVHLGPITFAATAYIPKNFHAYQTWSDWVDHISDAGNDVQN